MASVAFSANQDEVHVTIQIAAPPERVFEAITDPEQVGKWWGEQGLYRTTKRTADLRKGGQWRTEGVGAKGEIFSVEGEYLEFDPPRLLVHTWNPSYRPGLHTTVRWELKPQDGGTLVDLRHGGFADHPEAAQDHVRGWVRVLGWMQSYVEKGLTIDSRV